MARHGTHGIQLQMSDMAGTPAFTNIGQLVSVTPPSGSRGVTVIAEHDMTNAVDKLADALRDEGQVTFTVDLDPALATHDETTGFEEAFRSGDLTDFRLLFPSSPTKQMDFSAIITARSYEAYAANSGVGQATVTLDISGVITWS